MTLCTHRAFRVLAAVFCSLGVVGLAGGIPVAWAVLPLSALVPAMLWRGLMTDPLPVPARVQARRQTT